MVIVLNGPSSAGKTTLANAVRERLGPTAATVSIDKFFAFVPGVPNNWDTYATLTEAMFATAAALAKRFDVIVDTVFERLECHAIMQRVLGDAKLVAVTCPVDVLDARERARGNRRLGQAREQHGRVLHDLPYVLALDTHAQSLDDCTSRVIALLQK